MKNRSSVFCVAVAAVLALAGCGKKSPADGHDHGSHGSAHPAHADGAGSGHGHRHTPPHGGTGVVLGQEAFHLEFVLDPERGAMTAYVLDAHMENFVRCAETEFSVVAQADGKTETLVFKPVANLATVGAS